MHCACASPLFRAKNDSSKNHRARRAILRVRHACLVDERSAIDQHFAPVDPENRGVSGRDGKGVRDIVGL
jgi:hypothetical protein